MITTIRLDDELLSELRIYAASSGKTLTAVIEDAVRAMLTRQRVAAEYRLPVKLTTVTGQGIQPGVNLDDPATLLAHMDGAGDYT